MNNEIIISKLRARMCSRCSMVVHVGCMQLSENNRCDIMLKCIEKVLVVNDEAFPTELPEVK